MALIAKLLGSQTVAVSPGTTLYTVPPAKSAVVKTISLVNKHTSDITFKLYAVIGGTNRQLCSLDTILGGGAQAVFDDVVTLLTGGSILASASLALKLDVAVFGSSATRKYSGGEELWD